MLGMDPRIGGRAVRAARDRDLPEPPGRRRPGPDRRRARAADDRGDPRHRDHLRARRSATALRNVVAPETSSTSSPSPRSSAAPSAATSPTPARTGCSTPGSPGPSTSATSPAARWSASWSPASMRVAAVPRRSSAWSPAAHPGRRTTRPAAPSRRRPARRGCACFGVILWSAALTSVIGAAYTSVSFLTTSQTSERTRNLLTVGFIAVTARGLRGHRGGAGQAADLRRHLQRADPADRVRRPALGRLAPPRPAARLRATRAGCSGSACWPGCSPSTSATRRSSALGDL